MGNNDHTSTSHSHEPGSVKAFLLSCLPFNVLSKSDLEQTLKSLKIQYFRKGHTFHFAKTHTASKDLESNASDVTGLRILRSGAAEVRGENQQLLDRMGEYESFNLRGLNQGSSSVHVTLIEDSLIYYLDEQHYQTLRKNNREFDRYFHSQRSRRLRRAARYDPNPSDKLQPVSQVMSQNVLSISPSASAQEAAQAMSLRKLSSIVVMANDRLIGMVTDRDLRSRVLAKGLPASTLVKDIMTANPKTLEQTQTIFDATLLMTQQRIHHLPILHQDQVVGIITASDLMLFNQDDPLYIVQHIKRQNEASSIKSVLGSLPNLVVRWLSSGMKAEHVSKILTTISDSVTQHLIKLFTKKVGSSPVSYAWLAFGSQGRCEQLFNADQDNGIVIDNSVQPEDLKWFEELAKFVCDGLNECGYVYCPGNIMACNTTWRQTLSVWQSYARKWVTSPTPKAVMHTSIFFDIRSVYGEYELVNKLQHYMLEQAKNTIYLVALAQNALTTTPPIGIFRRLIVEHNGEHEKHINLKKRGILPIVELVRVHSLASGITVNNTHQRIQSLIDTKSITLIDGRNLADAYRIVMQIRLEHQASQLVKGKEPDNYINPKDLSDIQCNQLKDAFSIVSDAQQALKLNYRQGLD